MVTVEQKGEHKGTTGDRVLQVIQLFYTVKPSWSVEEAARELDISVSTSYRYFRGLLAVGMLAPSSAGQYVLGPAFIEIDRFIRNNDPVLQRAAPVMRWLREQAGNEVTVLLCRVYRDRVMCVHQERSPDAPPDCVGYERGKPMPLFRGATSKVILAHLPGRMLRRIFAANGPAIQEAGLGESFDIFKAALKAIRSTEALTTWGEVDPGRVGIAAALFDGDRNVLGSISVVLPREREREVRPRGLTLVSLVAAAAHTMNEDLRCLSTAEPEIEDPDS